jgi:hypothetical protein
MRSIACVMISFVCWYVGFHSNKKDCYIPFRFALVITGIGTLITSIILMAAGL